MFGAPAEAQDAATESTRGKTIITTRAIHQEEDFKAGPRRIVGRNLELVPDRRIVQAWRVVPWPEGIFSIARFELTGQGSGTRVIFDHTGFPTELAEHLASGWNENYWTALQKYFA